MSCKGCLDMNSGDASFRSDVWEKITGEAKYGADFYLANMLHAKTLWAPAPCAKILTIDTTAAEAAEGVVRVITRRDITGPNIGGKIGPNFYDHPVLVGEKETVKTACDALALIVAETEDQAAGARDLITVEYQELPAVHDVAQAIAAGHAPACEKQYKKGNLEQGFAEAAVIVEQENFTPFVEHSYIEPESGYAYPDNGVINVCAGTQDLRLHHGMICNALGLSYNKVKLSCPYVGGAFGGKHSISLHIHLALIVLLLRQPVRMVWTREESLSFSSKKQNLSSTVRLGLDAKGHICALQARIVGPCSPYLEKTPTRLNNYMKAMCGPYRIPNIDLEGRMYHTTCPEIGAFRGVAGPDGTFVIETIMDKAARRLGISPLAVRQINWMRCNKEFAEQYPGSLARNFSDSWEIAETMQQALTAAGPRPAPRAGKKVGRGIACAMPAYSVGNTDTYKGSIVELNMQLDGTMLVKLGFSEIGQGITAVVKSLVNDVFGLRADQVSVMLSDLFASPHAGPLGFSQATVTAGNALLDAADKLQALLIKKARACLGDAEARICFRQGNFYNEAGELALAWSRFSSYCYMEGISLSATGCVVDLRGEKGIAGVTPISGVVDVEVDEETGEVRVLRIVNCHDTGKVIHMNSARGQVMGSIVMSLGAALMEEFRMQDGRTLTPSLAEYIIPTAMDIPERMEVIFLEGNLANHGPKGAKGLGEHGMYVAFCALANAIYDAIGVHLTTLPITPEKVLNALSHRETVSKTDEETG